MSDFLQEKAAAAKAKKPKLPAVKTRLAAPAEARAARRPRKRSRELEELLRDFRFGLSSLRNLTQRLQTQPANYKGQQSVQQPAPPAITKIIERERRVVERLLTTIPTKERELILREYERHVQSSVDGQVPQAYAALIRGSEMVKPAQVLRPDQPYVRELMTTVKAIRSGRLPFLPKEVVTRARELLTVIFGKERAHELMTTKDAAMRRVISQQRLVPRSVRAAVSLVPMKKMTRVQQELQRVLARSIAPQHTSIPSQQLSKVELAQIEPVMPALHTGGAASSGEYRMEAGEDVHVITRNDSMMTSPSPGASGSAPRADVTTPALPGSLQSPAMAAPMPATSATPKKSDIAKAAAPFSRAEPSRAQFGGTGSAQPGGALKISDIEGLARWVAQTEERLGGLHG
ncbi:MAG TPA: hypothetical protein VLT59_04305 [Steroidobacteraceae bacterium]|nr:hypothetical protein [Steroidobacteraceae bacterium]